MGGRWVTPEKYRELRDADAAKTRAAYDWPALARDLALATPLTISQAVDLTFTVQEKYANSVKPYDLLPLLIRLVLDLQHASYRHAGQALKDLLDLGYNTI